MSTDPGRDSIDKELRLSRKGLPLPWLDEAGEPLPEFVDQFLRRPTPKGEPLGEQAGLVVAREVWDSLSDEERRLGLPVMQSPVSAERWLMAGVSLTGLSPEFAEWRASQRQLALAKILGGGWATEHEVPLSRMANLRRLLDERESSAFSRLCKAVCEKIEPAVAKNKGRRLAWGSGAIRALDVAGFVAPLAVGAAAFSGTLEGAAIAGVAATAAVQLAGALGRLGLAAKLGGGRIGVIPWLVARRSMPALKPEAIEAAQASAAAQWARCGALSEAAASLSRVSLDAKSKFWPSEMYLERVLEQGRRKSPKKTDGVAAARAVIERMAAALDPAAEFALGERKALGEALAQARTRKDEKGGEAGVGAQERDAPGFEAANQKTPRKASRL
jgi:hypothetical protein